MTDITTTQMALVLPSSNNGGSTQVMQSAMIVVCSETPPKAGGAQVKQMAIVAVSKEYTIPIILMPIGLGEFMATSPYYAGDY